MAGPLESLASSLLAPASQQRTLRQHVRSIVDPGAVEKEIEKAKQDAINMRLAQELPELRRQIVAAQQAGDLPTVAALEAKGHILLQAAGHVTGGTKGTGSKGGLNLLGSDVAESAQKVIEFLETQKALKNLETSPTVEAQATAQQRVALAGGSKGVPAATGALRAPSQIQRAEAGTAKATMETKRLSELLPGELTQQAAETERLRASTANFRSLAANRAKQKTGSDLEFRRAMDYIENATADPIAVARFQRDLEADLGRPPTPGEAADALAEQAVETIKAVRGRLGGTEGVGVKGGLSKEEFLQILQTAKSPEAIATKLREGISRGIVSKQEALDLIKQFREGQ